MGITCDRCGREMNGRWEIEDMPGPGGCCGDGCGDNLCAECGAWNEEGLCEYCAMSLEELEYRLPITVQRKEKKQMPCSGCKRDVEIPVNYEQRIWRSDDYFNGKKTRIYEISFYDNVYSHGKLFSTARHRFFRDALVEAHKKLDRLDLNPREYW